MRSEKGTFLQTHFINVITSGLSVGPGRLLLLLAPLKEENGFTRHQKLTLIVDIQMRGRSPRFK